MCFNMNHTFVYQCKNKWGPNSCIACQFIFPLSKYPVDLLLSGKVSPEYLRWDHTPCANIAVAQAMLFIKSTSGMAKLAQVMLTHVTALDILSSQGRLVGH